MEATVCKFPVIKIVVTVTKAGVHVFPLTFFFVPRVHSFALKPQLFPPNKTIPYSPFFHLIFIISLLPKNCLNTIIKLHVIGCYVYLPGQNKTLFYETAFEHRRIGNGQRQNNCRKLLESVWNYEKLIKVVKLH